jgi:hypothetical protein
MQQKKKKNVSEHSDELLRIHKVREREREGEEEEEEKKEEVGFSSTTTRLSLPQHLYPSQKTRAHCTKLFCSLLIGDCVCVHKQLAEGAVSFRRKRTVLL